MYCIQCGTELPQTAMFCLSCGRRRHTEATVSSQPSSVTVGAGTSRAEAPVTRTKSRSKWLALSIVGALVGAGVGRYSGLSLLIPLAGAGAAWAIGSRVVTDNARHFLPAVSVQTGHVVWFLVGLLALGSGGLQEVWFDILLMVAGLVWLVLKPGLGPVVLLTAWQLLALAFNLQVFLEATVGTAAHKALLVHVVLRMSSIGLMVTGLIALRRSAQEEATAA